MVCIPCFIVPVLLFIWHKFLQPILLKYWNPWKKVEADGAAGSDATGDTAKLIDCSGGSCRWMGRNNVKKEAAVKSGSDIINTGGEEDKKTN